MEEIQMMAEFQDVVLEEEEEVAVELFILQEQRNLGRNCSIYRAAK